MPIYEYECTKCGNEMEIVHGISEKPRRKCPDCGGRLKRLISLNSFHLKGTGWYKTDYAKPEKKPEPEKTSGKEAGKEAVKSETVKSETKKSEKKESTSAAKP